MISDFKKEFEKLARIVLAGNLSDPPVMQYAALTVAKLRNQLTALEAEIERLQNLAPQEENTNAVRTTATKRKPKKSEDKPSGSEPAAEASRDRDST